MDTSIKKNKYGFCELAYKPTADELSKYYAEKYYQQATGSYEQRYREDEIEYFYNKIEQKYYMITKNMNRSEYKGARLLDIGCGEGWALNYFKDKGWDVMGLDYSKYGCEMQNPECLSYVTTGDIYEEMRLLCESKQVFDCIWLDNVLEHVLEPLKLLEICRELVSTGGVLMIEVPNDFSIVQQYLLQHNYIERPFWLAIPDHISYFNIEGLKGLCFDAGWDCQDTIMDFPIDFNLFNENTNYVNNPIVGKKCHAARVSIENVLHNISVEKVNKLYQAFAEIGVGREITGIFRKR